jgi:signal transduction histidine kinase
MKAPFGFFRTFRFQVALLIVMIVLPTLLLYIFINLKYRRREIADLKRYLADIAQIIRVQEIDLVDGTAQLLSSIAVLEEKAPNVLSRNSSYLSSLLERYPRYLNIGIADAEGMITGSAVPLRTDINVSSRPFFRRALEERVFVVSPYDYSPVIGQETIVLAEPLVSDSNDVEAIVFASLNTSSLLKHECSMISRISEAAVLTKIDERGTIIVQAGPRPGTMIGRPFPQREVLDVVLRTQIGIVEMPGADGNPHMYAFTNLASRLYDAPLYLILDVPTAELLATANSTFSSALLIIIAAGVVTFIATWIFARFTFVRQINLLVRVSEKIGKGELDARCDLARFGTRELHALGASIYRMASDLKERDSRLRHQQRLETIGVIASGTAHEINNPLTGIIGYADLMRRKTDLPREIMEYVEEISREAGRIELIVKNLLSFARRNDLILRATSILEIVEVVLSLTQSTVNRDQIRIDVDVPQNLPKILCSPQQIEQVLMNLLSNAQDALNEKYPEYDENKAIGIKAVAVTAGRGECIRLTVEDSGAGIPEEVREHIFEPFYTTKSYGKGTGLGLHISRDIVAAHGGTLSVESVFGEWTRFCVELPSASGYDGIAAPGDGSEGELLSSR